MPDQIGARLSSLRESAGVMDTTGTAAEEAGTTAQNASSQMKGSIDDATSTMQSHFNRMADDMRTQISQAHQSLMNTEWTGSARQRAEELEQELNSKVSSVLGDAEGAAQEFKTQAQSQADEYFNRIQSEFKSVMNEIRASYSNFSQEEQNTASRLEEADASSFAG